MISDDLRRAYYATEYHVFAEPQFVLRPGKVCSEADVLLARLGTSSGIVLTAWNPMSKPTDDATNNRAQDELVSEIGRLGLAAVPAEGRGIDTAWPPEPSYFIPGPSPQIAHDLAVHFRQAAWVHVAVGEPVRIIETDFGGATT